MVVGWGAKDFFLNFFLGGGGRELAHYLAII